MTAGIKILLTGATGYLGSHIHRRLSELGYNVIPFSRHDDPDSCIMANLPEIIIHCATCYGRKNESEDEIRRANVGLPTRLVRAAAKARTHAFINTDSILPPATSLYAKTKHEFREFLRAYEQIPIRINLQFEQFFGPGDNDGKFTTFLIRKLLANAASIPMTAGEQRRHFLFIDDAVDAYRVVLSSLTNLTSGFRNYQVSSDECVTVREFARLAKLATGNTSTVLDFGALPYRANELMDSVTDTSEIKQLGWNQNHTLLEAITKTVKGEREHEISH